MQLLYSGQSESSVSRKLNQRFVVLFTVLVLLLAVFIWAMVSRVEWLAMVSVCLVGCFAVFYSDLFCAPLLRYRRLVRSALSGRHHEKAMEFSRLEPDSSVVDGVSRRSLIFLGDPDKHGSRDVLMYWDQAIPLPDLEEGRIYTVRYTGKSIIGIQPEGLSSRL